MPTATTTIAPGDARPTTSARSPYPSTPPSTRSTPEAPMGPIATRQITPGQGLSVRTDLSHEKAEQLRVTCCVWAVTVSAGRRPTALS